MNKLREIADSGYNDKGLYSWRDGDSSCGVVPFCEQGSDFPSYLVMTWYKNRGRTSRAYVMGDDDEPAVLTLVQAETILAEYTAD